MTTTGQTRRLDDLVHEVAKKASMSKTDAKKAINATMETIRDIVIAGDQLTLVDFGTFRSSTRRARPGVNPQTREKITIPEHQTVSFTASRTWSARLGERGMARQAPTTTRAREVGGTGRQRGRNVPG